MYKIFVSIAFFALFATSGFTTPPANAMTGEEFLKLLGVLGRYSDDINRTFRPNQTIPTPQPNIPQPDRSQPTPQDSIPTPDRLLEQFFPHQ
jgi:hypothetical protein